MQHFDLVFLIQLRYVSEKSSLPEIIKNQYHMLRDVPNEFLKSILFGHSHHKVLLLMDGYDEYMTGTNKDIDEAIRYSIGNCLLIITSRPGYISQRLRKRMDREIFILGLSQEGIRKYSAMLLERDKSISMLETANQAGVGDVLYNPTLLNMVSTIYNEEKTFTKTRTGLIRASFELSIDRTTMKTFGVKAEKVENIRQMIHVLGELSWEALQNQRFLRKVLSIVKHNFC